MDSRNRNRAPAGRENSPRGGSPDSPPPTKAELEARRRAYLERQAKYYRAEAARRKRNNRRLLWGSILAIGLIGIIILSVGLKSGLGKSGTPETIASQTTAVTETAVPENASPTLSNGIVVCIDPAHGYSDSGNTGEVLSQYSLTEADVTLKASLLLKQRLTELGFTVVLTRENNDMPQGNSSYALSNEERCNIANGRDRLDVLISLHCDISDDSTACGPCIYYYNGTYTQTKSLADAVAAVMTTNNTYAATKTSEQTYADAISMCSGANAPSLHIELGYVTNTDDAARMADDSWYTAIVNSIAAGVQQYSQAVAISPSPAA